MLINDPNVPKATEADLVNGSQMLIQTAAGTKKGAADLFAVKSTQESIAANLVLSKTDTAITKHDGKVVNEYGQLVDVAYHYYTDPVQLDPGSSVTIKCCAQASIAVIAVLNANNTYTVKVLGKGGSDYIFYSYKNNGTESQNVVFSFKAQNAPSSVIVSSCDITSYEYVDEKDKALTDKVQDIIDFGELSTSSESITKNAGKFVNQYGQLTDDAYHYYTDPITLQPGQSISFEARGTNTLVSVISLYSSGTYKPQVVSVDSNYKNYGWKNDCSSSVQVVLSFKLDKAPSVVRVTSSQAVSMIGIANITNTSKFASMDDLPYGCCNVTNSAALSNKPTSGDYTCITFGNSERTYVVQIAFANRMGTAFKRKKFGGTWQSWNKMLDYSDFAGIKSLLSNQFKLDYFSASYTLTNGYYVQWDGQLVALASYSYSSDIELKPNETIMFFGAGASTNVAMISVHEGGLFKCVARSIDNDSNWYMWTNDTGANKNVVVCFNARYAPSGVEIVKKKEDHVCTPSLSVLDSIGCLGDSFTDGILCDEDGNVLGSFGHKYSWPTTLSKMCGIPDVTNYGVSGASTRTAKTNPNQLPKILSDDPKQLYLLCLGINDAWQEPAGYIGTPADMDTEDYTQSANSFYGNYYYIIKSIQEHAPKATVIMLPPHNFKEDSFSDFFNATKTIAQTAGIPWIYTGDIDRNPAFRNRQGSHPTVTGYGVMAKYYKRLIENWMQGVNMMNLEE